MSRRKARELALQFLYQLDLVEGGREEVAEVFWSQNPIAEETRQFAESLVDGYLQRASNIDEMIQRASKNWRLERMAAVDRTVIRLAVSEFLYTDTPKAVVIDEAIEVARRFSTEDSAEFVNGILDAVLQELES